MAKTIYDIAKAAGVSIATVSRVFNNPSSVTEKTRKKVLKVAEKMGYHPQAFAQGLASKRKNIIMAVVPIISNYFFMEILAGIQDKISDQDIELNIVNVMSGDDVFEKTENLIKRKWAAGYLLISLHMQEEEWKALSKFNTPISLIDDHCSYFDSVSVDNRHGAYSATEYLIRKGYTRIAMLSALETSIPVVSRHDGYREALESNGLAYDNNLVISGDSLYRDGFTEKAGYEAMKKILAIEPKPEACFCSSDIQAIGALKALRDAGTELPMISFDDLSVAEYVGLSTVKQPIYEMGYLATQNLIERIENRKKSVSQTTYTPELIIRSSSEENVNMQNVGIK